MRKRLEAAVGVLNPIRFRPFPALRAALAEGYGPEGLRADVLSGVVVGIVALPLSMALAIASGVPPQNGLYTAVVAGAVTALLGGSRVQVSGPTAAFVVLLAPVAAQFGLGGLLLATVLAGLILVAMGIARFGGLLRFVPHPVVTGFTAGIAVVIATLQLPDLLGLTLPGAPEGWLDRVAAIAGALGTLRPGDAGVGLATLAVLVAWPRVTSRVPAALVGLTVGALLAAALGHLAPGLEPATIASRFHYVVDGVAGAGIPAGPPLPLLPWNAPGADGTPVGLSWELLRALLPAAFAIAVLGAIESLLSATVADGMTGRQHDPDAELVAQGVGNLVAPFFGGFAATGAIARTAVNVRSGARSPVSAVVHAAFVLVSMLALSPLLGRLPLASLAALLLVVAWNMSEARHFAHVLKVAPRSDALVLVVCFGLTVVFDMVVAVSAGVVLAALLFMRRMAEVGRVRLVGDAAHLHPGGSPPEVLVYEVAGPLFFGAAQRAMGMLEAAAGARVVVLDLAAVPVMDATGLVNLESAVERLGRKGMRVVLCGVGAQPGELMRRVGLCADGRALSAPDLAGGLSVARALLGETATATQGEEAAPAPTAPAIASGTTGA